MKKLSLRKTAALSVFALTAAALVGCGPKTQEEVKTAPTTRLEAEVVQKTSDGSVSRFLTSKGEGVVTGGTQGVLNITGVPEGATVEVTSTDATAIEKSGNDYVFTAPEVTGETDITITVTVKMNQDGQEYVYSKDCFVKVVPESMFATGYQSYVNDTAEERDVTTAALEGYIMNNGLSPITFVDTGGFQLYNERVHSPSLDEGNYIPGYGFGVTTYGTIDAPLAGEQTEEFKMYYHSQLSASLDEGSFNDLRTNSGNPSYFSDNISMNYFGTYVNEDATGYEYGPGTSRLAAPEAVNPDENGNASTWKIYLRVGGDQADEAKGVTPGFNWRVNSSVPAIAAFDQKPIQLKDYLTPFKVLATQSVNWFRGTEMAGEDNPQQIIKGFAQFFNSTANATDLVSDEEFMNRVGVKIDETDNSLTIEFEQAFSPEFAEYYLNGVFANPMSEEFLRVLGNGNALEGTKLFGVNGTVGGTSVTPQDTRLSVGPYYTYYYESKKTVAFKKNETWPITKDPYGRDIYQIEGFHYNLNSRLDSDPNTTIEMWEQQQTDVSDIPTDYWDKYLTDPRKVSVTGSAYFPIYFANSWSDQTHSFIFPESTWEVKQMLANNNFHKGLIVGIDRNAIADYYHQNPSYGIQEPANRSTPKASVAHNSSDAWKEAVKDSFGSSMDDFSNWRGEAANYFELAIQEELEAGHYALGTGENPTVVELEFVTTDDTDRRYCDSVIFANWEDAFELAVTTHFDEDGTNSWVDEQGRPRIVLDVGAEVVAVSDPALQSKIISQGVQAGNYDGQTVYRVTGNGADTVGNLDKYITSNPGGFTLNYGPITSVASPDLFFDGKYWSFDGLQAAGSTGNFIDEYGTPVSLPLSLEDATKNADGSVSVVCSIPMNQYVKDVQGLALLNLASGGDGSTYTNPGDIATTFDPTTGKVTFTVPSTCIWDGADYTGNADYAGMALIDVQLYVTLSDGTHTVNKMSTYASAIVE